MSRGAPGTPRGRRRSTRMVWSMGHLSEDPVTHLTNSEFESCKCRVRIHEKKWRDKWFPKLAFLHTVSLPSLLRSTRCTNSPPTRGSKLRPDVECVLLCVYVCACECVGLASTCSSSVLIMSLFVTCLSAAHLAQHSTDHIWRTYLCAETVARGCPGNCSSMPAPSRCMA